MSTLTVGAARYPFDPGLGLAAFADKQARWLEDARAAGAGLALLPEYLALEMAGADTRGDLAASMAAIQPHHDDWVGLFGRLARELSMHIAAGTFLLDAGGGRHRNRSYVFAPDGSHAWQDKLRLTGFEKRSGLFEPGDALKVLETGPVRSAVSVCYDSEFPLPVRAQYEAGARLLLVPSCTDSEAGATRVRVGCLARALENRCFVAHAVTCGPSPLDAALGSTGEAALYAPMDVGLPADGVLAGTRGAPGWAIAELDFGALERSRATAQVSNDRDWRSQYFPSVSRATVAAFTG